jgi:predicted amidohydrolase
MQISCVLNAAQVSPGSPDLIVFPEGVAFAEIEKASYLYPKAVIVAAVEENGRSRAVLLHRGQNYIDYLKLGTDGRTTGTENVDQNPVYEYDNTCIGVLICMDVDHTAFSRTVINKIKASECGLKLLCVPADMAGHWFIDDSVSSTWHGVHVILCNHTKTHRVRCKSFVTDVSGRKIRVQKDAEPIHIELPITRFSKV